MAHRCARIRNFTAALGMGVASVTQADSCQPGQSASDAVRIARYSVIAPVATSAQADLLEVVVNIRFPRSIDTVGGALQHLLRRSGYRLQEPHTGEELKNLLPDLPLPEVHRTLGPITLKNALMTLVGPGYRMSGDPLQRSVSFAPDEASIAARSFAITGTESVR